ncbi:organic solute transporter Ostalpha-domain-containing protein [Lobosporangium transversale]|uniref:Organic solute transporter Ostalpha-domain-containing protein n=1 Tax=Lobosporangium transversale TaxID=64571 RepID=A0A1Y2GYD7_9FUNG|nr:organic solute transporter Ostalpha-domain-containing protein [Lobosporangium transversale]ORZ26781.1 organic solute transporter Ostalpha-domain-containing protein [Lobosporangium transversale]|eukprot:XP_021884544.1 organic solute transporter Ostalpha-domain-containing protein [Lobosporangium transversale]
MTDANTTTLLLTDPDSIGVPSTGGSGAELPSIAVWAAGGFAFTATMISMVAIWMQLKHYRKPLLQRYVVRILLMVPIFAISSWISLVSLSMAFYVDALRDIYEAFVIYCFFGLLVSYLGGERSLLLMLHGRPYTKHLFPVCLWHKEIDVGDPYSFLFIKRGILQYVYVKPVLAAATMLLKSNGAYNDGSISLESGYFWVSFIYNLSVCLSLYCLGVFFMATQDDLEEFRPIPKFLSIKVVIFFSFWQGFAISLLVATGLMSNTSPEIAVAIQDFLICFEMVFAALGHWYAFSHRDYTETDIQSARMPVYYAIRDACGIQDIIQDSLETLKGTRFTYRTFEPSEGMATVGKSRDGRIAAGLRYSQGGQTKYWLPEPESPVGPMTERTVRHDSSGIHDSSSKRGLSRPQLPDRAPSLHFYGIGDDDDDIEELYDASKQMEYGDYNFPAIDVYDPSKQQVLISKDDAYNFKKIKDSTWLSQGKNRSSLVSKGISSIFGREGWTMFTTLPVSTPIPQTTGETVDRSMNMYATLPTSSPAPLLKGEGGMVQWRYGCIDNVNGYIPQRKPRREMRRSGHPKPEQFDAKEFGFESYQQAADEPQQQDSNRLDPFSHKLQQQPPGLPQQVHFVFDITEEYIDFIGP